MEFSNINWTDHTWNPWIGCPHVSAECDHCYADFLVSKRMGRDFGAVTRTKTWRDPIKWNSRAPELQAELGRRVRVFCASLTDFFIQDADAWREEAWKVIRDCANLDFLILTKRPRLIPSRLPADWGRGYANVWLGTTCGVRSSYTYREKSYLYYDFMCRDFFKWMSEQDEDQEYWKAPGSGQYVYGKGLFQYKAKRCYNISLEAIEHETADPKREWSAKQKWREVFGTAFPD